MFILQERNNEIVQYSVKEKLNEQYCALYTIKDVCLFVERRKIED